MLSRGVGRVGKYRLVNLPESVKAISESLDALFPGIMHIYRMLAGPEGFDPSTSGLEGKRSIQTEICSNHSHITSGLFWQALLSYGPVTMFEPL